MSLVSLISCRFPVVPALLRRSIYHEEHEGHEGCKNENSKFRDLRVLRGKSILLFYGCGSVTPISFAANSTACNIFVYPVQRQRFPERAWRISSRVGCGFSSSNAL